MTIRLEPATLDSECGDSEARLVLRDGRLVAIISCLGDLHGALIGRWFVEAVFGDHPLTIGQMFESPDALAASLAPAGHDGAS